MDADEEAEEGLELADALLLLPPLLLLSLLAAVEVAVEAARVVVAHVQQRIVGASHLALARQAAVSE